MALSDLELLHRERQLWMGVGRRADVFAEHFAEDGRCVLRGRILTRAELVAYLVGHRPWQEVDFEEVWTRVYAAGVVALTYRIRAVGDDVAAPFRAVATSVYVPRRDRSMLVLHQQSESG